MTPPYRRGRAVFRRLGSIGRSSRAPPLGLGLPPGTLARGRPLQVVESPPSRPEPAASGAGLLPRGRRVYRHRPRLPYHLVALGKQLAVLAQQVANFGLKGGR